MSSGMNATNLTSIDTSLNGTIIASDADKSPDIPVPWLVRLLVTSTVSFLIVTTNVINITVMHRITSIPSNAKVYLTSLSVADLMVGLVTCTPAVAAICLDSWPYGVVWCQISGVMHGTSGAVSIWSLSLVSVDRYLALLRPLHHATMVTSRRRTLVLLSQWLLAVLLFLAPVLSRPDLQYYRYSRLEGLCGLHWELPAFCLATGLAIPMASGAVIAVTTFRILRHLRRSERAVLRSTKRASWDRRAWAILGGTAATYFLCWGPYSLEVMLTSLSPALTPPPQLHYACLWLANCNSFLNVLIYSAVYRAFRQQVRQLLKTAVTCGCSWGCCPADTETEQQEDRVSRLAALSTSPSLTTLTSLNCCPQQPFQDTSSRIISRL